MRITEKELIALAKNNKDLQPLIFEMKKESKYRNIKVYVYSDGYITEGKKEEGHGKPSVFDSKKEYGRWRELLLLEKAGEIRNLERQKEYIIKEGGVYRGKKINAIKYKADFTYTRGETLVVEDVKPIDKKTKKERTTKEFRIKWKMLMLLYPDISFEIY